MIAAVPDTPAVDCWTALTAAASRPDVPADVRTTITAALAYHQVIAAELDTMLTRVHRALTLEENRAQNPDRRPDHRRPAHRTGRHRHR